MTEDTKAFLLAGILSIRLSGTDLPIWIASFALADYGTGMVKCSAHDERDFAFAKKYNIPFKGCTIYRLISLSLHVRLKTLKFAIPIWKMAYF